MKRGIFVLLCACFLVACSEEKFESQEIVIESQGSEEFNAVLNNIASLNDKFGCNEISTKSGPRDFFYQVADYAGGYYGAKLGSAVGFAAGTAVGSPAFGAFIMGGCGMLGGMAGSAVASKLFDMVCDYAGIGYSESVESLPGYYYYHTFYPFDESAGSVHNAILDALENNGKDYIDEDGNIMVEDLFHDALEYEESLHLDGGVYDTVYIYEVKSFCKDLYNTIRVADSQGMDGYQVCDKIYGLLRVKGCSENEVMELEALSNALLPCTSLDIEEVSSYELEFNNIIESSKLDECDKVCLETAGSVYIHSIQYWY